MPSTPVKETMASTPENPAVGSNAEKRSTSPDWEADTERGESTDSVNNTATSRKDIIDPVVSARALRKIDWWLMPAMIYGYGQVYYDKAILGSAALFGMTDDLQLQLVDENGNSDTTRLSWATSLFYFGMLAGLYPMTFALQKIDMGRLLGCIVCLWAVTCASTVACTDYKGLYVQRFFLGVVESIVPTGFMCIVSNYYTQQEQSMRQSWWFSSTGLFIMIGGGINYGFATIESGSLAKWQYIYIMAGATTFIFALMCFVLPNNAGEAWFLKKDERIAAKERLRLGQTGIRETDFKWSHVKEAVLDIKTWLIFVMMAASYTMNGCVSGFGPIIVNTLGWTPLQSLLLQFPMGFCCFASILICGYLGTYFKNIRIVMMIVTCLFVMVGCIMIWKSSWYEKAPAPVIGYSLTGIFGATVCLVITIGMSNTAGSTKKSFMSATIFVAYCVGNIVGPQLVFSETQDQHYPALWTGIIICYVITIICGLVLYWVLWRENKKKEAYVGNEEEKARFGFEDLTDKENPYFRYVF